MNQQQNTLVAYMTCKNLTIGARQSKPIHPSVSVLCNPNPFRFTRARVALSPPFSASSPSRYARSSSHRCGTLHPGVKRRLERDEPERRQYESHFFCFSASSSVDERVLSDSCEAHESCVTNRRTNQRTMGAEGKRRLLTLDDITPRLRGATGGRERERIRG